MHPFHCFEAADDVPPEHKGGFFMLYTVIQNGEEISYVPTTLGNVLLAIVFVALLAAAGYFLTAALRSLRKKKKESTAGKSKLTPKKLAFCAVAVALGTVLSNVKLFHFPTGGSITPLSMLMICLPGYWFGLGAGLISGVSYGILQLVIDPYVIHPLQLIIEYLLAFGALGLSGLFMNGKFGLLKGYATGIIGRWFFASLSGWVFFAEYAWTGWNPLIYSLTYNAIYIFSEAAITLLILWIPPVKNALSRVRQMAVFQ